MENPEYSRLPSVIGIYEDECINCHACIGACPVKFCNNGSGSHISINPDLCIACGSCIAACTHNARFFIDDFDKFLRALQNKQKIVAVVAPSIAASFPDQHLQINAWLRSIGVEAIFDVSFGAELTVKSYVEYIKKESPKTVIAQPCPAIVTYIQIYQPELIKYLAPADSPILHTMKMIKHFYPKFKKHKLALISPCNAKKREFHQTGIGDYNIAYQSINKYLNENKIDLNQFSPVDFDNPPAERAVVFSSPGGLQQTLDRNYPEYHSKTRVIEGNPKIYDYLKHLPEILKKEMNPVLIDCLNCEFGCNAGPLTLAKEKSVDEIEFWITKRKEELKHNYLKKNNYDEKLSTEAVEKTISEYWIENLYDRTYHNLWHNLTIKYPTKKQQDEIFKSMHKYSENDIYNCTSCGYGKCEQMAIAIFNNLNRPDNCHFFLGSETEKSRIKIEQSKNFLASILDTSLDGFVQIDIDGVIVSSNDSFRKIIKRSNVIGRKILDFLDETNKKIIIDNIKLRQENIQSSYEIQFLQSDEKLIDCLVSGTPLFDESKNRIGSFAMISDISALKKAEKELRKANEELEMKVQERTLELQNSYEELKTASETLTAYSQQLEQLSWAVSRTDNAIAIIEPNGTIEWINTAFEKIHRISLIELKQKGKDNLVKVSSYDKIKEKLKECVKNKKAITYSCMSWDYGNRKRWIQTTLTPILDGNDNVIKLIAIDSDISQLKIAEEEILMKNEELLQQREEILTQTELLEDVLKQNKENQQLLNDIFESLPDAVLVIDQNKNILAWNKAMEKLTGRNSKEMIGKGNFEYAVPFYGERRPMLIDLLFSDIDQYKEKYEDFKKPEKILTGESYVENLQGNEAYLFGTAAVLHNISGEIIGAIEIIRNITEQKYAHEKILEQNEEITKKSEQVQQAYFQVMQSEQKLTDIINSIPDGILVVDNQKNILAWNKAMEELTGMKLEDIPDKDDYAYAIPFYGERRPILVDCIFDESLLNKKLYKKIIKSGETLIAESIIKRKNKPQIHILITVARLYNFNGDVDGAIEIIKDITDRVLAEQQILKQKEEIIIKTQELAEKVEELRTTNEIIEVVNSELEDKNTEIENQKQELLATNELLVMQKKEIEIHRDELEQQKRIVTKQRDEISYHQKQITDSILYAKRIQSAILPTILYIKRLFPSSFVFFRPKDIVSGDFYYIRQRHNKIYLAAADCTGHGVPGATMSMLGFAFLNEILTNINKDTLPGEVLTLLRSHIIKVLRQKGKTGETQDGMDISFAIIDYDEWKVQFSGANSPLYLIKNKQTGPFNKETDFRAISGNIGKNAPERIRVIENGDYQLVELCGEHMPIGIYLRDADFSSFEIKFKSADSIYLFSDGFHSQFGGIKNRKFLAKNFKDLILSIQNYSMLDQNSILEETFDQWKGKLPQVDDILVMGCKL